MASDGATIEFNHFDSVPLATDHKYIGSSQSKNCLNNATIMTIMKEWKILRKSLPDSIYVHVYETRIALLRAVIIGPAGTPYHDGLFFFDIVLPSDYPNRPPEVYYHSFGYRLNPNLYENGVVCLSLINTWYGRKPEERWTRGSTILQLLVSLQGLMLNARPVFNEPLLKMGKGSKFFLWKMISNSYNEDSFILSCQTMMEVFRHPPKNFESFVAQHFRLRAASVLAAIEHYKQGLALVGQFEMNGAASSSSKPVRVSNKFKSRLTKIQGQLKHVFAPFIPCPSNAEATALVAERGDDGDQSEEKNEQQEKGLLQRLTSSVKKIFE
ncbi:hypothetical protein C2S51_010036 [Perilla frutescens var. frutescens]|nr:hypothetical protein C2S51_010036 [Perilla frutescens var. frutescens]